MKKYMLSNKERYKTFCDEHPEIPLFMQYWWMEAASVGKEWDVLFYEENNRIKATFVYLIVKKFNFKFILQPMLSQYSGLWIDYPPDITPTQKLNIEKKIMSNFIEQIESLKFAYFEQNFHYSVANWLPFHWKKYRQTTRYTYQIKDIKKLENVYESFSYAKQKHIKKNNDNLQIDISVSAEDFYNFHKEYLKQKGKGIEYSLNLFLTIYNETIRREQGIIVAIKDKNQNLHSALFVVWDKKSAYCLISAINPQFKSDGASTKMFWEAIKLVSTKTEIFDFEGSMIEGVAQSFQQFGTHQVPYFNIRKSKSFVFDVGVRLKIMPKKLL